jgi:TolB-like protein/DNA-binding winged helix-turn-helix (wHTH) protein/Tfp pilus assembly protein PilF
VGPSPFAVSFPIRFGDDFEFDPRAQKLCRAGRLLKLERIPTEILLLLIEKNGELVTRDQIVERVWGEGAFLDTDNSINGAVRKIRQVLRDDPENPRFIQTVTGRGYRFIAPVTPAAPLDPDPPADRPVADVLSPDAPPERIPSRDSSRWLRVSLIGIVVLAAGLAAHLYNLRSHAPTPGHPPRPMLAVLPFENLTGDPEQEYFSDGLTEEMISQLGNLDPSHLGVIARTSVMRYKHTDESLDRIGRELGVQYALEGSVRRDADKVRITAQLIQVKDQSHIWARQYDRDLSNLLALQAEIAQEIAAQIQLTLGDHRRLDTARPSSPGPSGYEAYDLYLKGRFFWNKRTGRGFQQAIDYFQQAIAKDPNYSRAYTGLADSYTLLGGYNAVPQTESMPKARSAALKALELDPDLAEAHTSLALIEENFDYDWQTAEKEYRRAIELNPNYATAHHWYAEYLSLQGRFPEALAESESARELDPLSLIIAADHAMILFYARQYDASIAQFRSVKEMEPAFPRAGMVVAPYIENRQFAEALAELKDWDNAYGEGAWSWAWRAFVYGRSGQNAQAQQALAKVRQYYHQGFRSPDPMLWALIGVGDRDQAFVWLEKAYSDHSNVLTSLKVNPAFDALRPDPRFQNLMRRVRLAP